jgi:uncharacterized protein with HEPN domain
MEKDELVYIGHMLDFARKATRFVAGVDRATYDADEKLQLALTQLIQRIGEAARRVSQPFHAAHPDLPWNEITGMRSKIVHDYLEIDNEAIWDTVTKDLPRLIPQLEAILPDEPPEG